MIHPTSCAVILTKIPYEFGYDGMIERRWAGHTQSSCTNRRVLCVTANKDWVSNLKSDSDTCIMPVRSNMLWIWRLSIRDNLTREVRMSLSAPFDFASVFFVTSSPEGCLLTEQRLQIS